MKNLEMKNLTPDLYAPINPNEGAAGFRLGMQYADFLEQTVHLFINDYLAESIGDNFWRVYEQKNLMKSLRFSITLTIVIGMIQ